MQIKCGFGHAKRKPHQDLRPFGDPDQSFKYSRLLYTSRRAAAENNHISGRFHREASDIEPSGVSIADYTRRAHGSRISWTITSGGAPSDESGGVRRQGGEIAKESYAASIIYENVKAKTVGQIPNGPTMIAVNTAVTRESPGMQP